MIRPSQGELILHIEAPWITGPGSVQQGWTHSGLEARAQTDVCVTGS